LRAPSILRVSFARIAPDLPSAAANCQAQSVEATANYGEDGDPDEKDNRWLTHTDVAILVRTGALVIGRSAD
jgi:hypothetical protein